MTGVLECKKVYENFRSNGVELWVGVPDSLLADFCWYLNDHVAPERHLVAANEGSAIALAAGHFFATGRPAGVYLQNSGLGNTVNPLTSLADPQVYGVAMILLVGWRGEPGTADEPQHRKMGECTVPTLDAIGVEHSILPREDAPAAGLIARVVKRSLDAGRPHALLVHRDTFSPIERRQNESVAPSQPGALTREAAIAILLDHLGPGTAIVSTTGKASRELFTLRQERGERHDADLLTVGSMGHCSQIALGVALARPERRVLCLDGDGSVLMHLGGLTTIGTAKVGNLLHVVLNNGAHDSVGGQPTVGQKIDLCRIAEASGYISTRCVATGPALSEALVDAKKRLDQAAGPQLIEVRVRRGARADLGRPTRTPSEAKARFMRFLGE